jgi:hypothetical protein
MKHIPFIICLMLAATPGILIATLPAWATKENITIVPKTQLPRCDETNTFTDHSLYEGDVVCYSV